MNVLYIFVPIVLAAIWVQIKRLDMEERKLLLEEKKYRDSSKRDSKCKR